MSKENKAVFLDRDGVLIHDVSYLSSIEQIRFYGDVADSLMRLKKINFKLIVVTNQSGVARGYFDEAFVRLVHKYMNDWLQKNSVMVDDFFYCPHYLDGNPPYDIDCHCRKPNPGMVLEAVNKHQLDVNRCFMVGDKASDIEMAVRSKIHPILVETGQGQTERDAVRKHFPDTFVAPAFAAAADYILQCCDQDASLLL